MSTLIFKKLKYNLILDSIKQSFDKFILDFKYIFLRSMFRIFYYQNFCIYKIISIIFNNIQKKKVAFY